MNQSEQKCLCVKIKSAPRLDNFMPGKLCLTVKVGWLFADFIILLPPQRKRKMNASLSVRNKMCGSAKDEGKNVLNQSERMSLFLFKGSTRNFIIRKIGYLYCFSLLHISWSCCSGHFQHRNNFTPNRASICFLEQMLDKNDKINKLYFTSHVSLQTDPHPAQQTSQEIQYLISASLCTLYNKWIHLNLGKSDQIKWDKNRSWIEKQGKLKIKTFEGGKNPQTNMR